ncbi:MAG: fused MFS/spermidine synthase [Pseudoclavibacter sp.]
MSHGEVGTMVVDTRDSGGERAARTPPAPPALPPLDIVRDRTSAHDIYGVTVAPAGRRGEEPRTWLVVDRATGEAMLIDPAGDRSRVLELVYEAQERAEDEHAHVPRVARILLTRRVDEAAATLTRVRRRLAAPVFAGSPDGSDVLDCPLGDDIDAVAQPGVDLPLGDSHVRVVPLHAGSRDGIGIIVEAVGDGAFDDAGAAGTSGAGEATASPAHLFVGDALGASGPPRLGRDRVAAMTLTMQLERGLLEDLPGDARVWRRRAEPTTIAELRAQAPAWRREYGLPATSETAPVWFTPAGSTMRLRRLAGDQEHPDHRFVMIMVGSTVHSCIDPADPFAFADVYGVYPPIAAFLGLGPSGADWPGGRRRERGGVRTLHLGAGALAVPRMISAALPGSTHVAVDLEPAIVDFALTHLPLADPAGVSIVEGDARAVVDRFVQEGEAPFDAIVVDVFDRLTVPRQVSSVEAFAAMRELLVPGSLVVANLPADPGSEAARVVVAAMRQVFSNVAVAAPAPVLDDERSGNVIVAGTDAPLRLDDVARRLRGEATEHRVLEGDELDDWLGASAHRPLRDA